MQNYTNSPSIDNAREIPNNYRNLIKQANIPRETIAKLNEINTLKASLDLANTILVIFATPLIFYFIQNAYVLVICFFINIHAFNRFAQLIHGSDHGWLFRSSSFNNFWGNLSATFIGYTRAGHQTSHQLHHVYLNTENDSDLIWGAPDENMNSFFRSILFDLSGVTALKRLMQYSQIDKKNYSNEPWKKISLTTILNAIKALYPVVFTQLIIILYYSYLIGFKYYLIIYALPLCTLYPCFIRLRSLVEHSYPVDQKMQDGQKLQIWFSRTVNASLIERAIFAPLDIPYHFEHHVYPGIPYYNLHKLNKVLTSHGIAIPTAPGYFGFLIAKYNSDSRGAISN